MNDDRALRPTFGQFVAARRKTLNLTQAELAALAHTTEKTIRNYETGVTFPDPKTYQLLKFALHWEGDAINDALDGWSPETAEEHGGGILWNRLPAELREPLPSSEAAWGEAWRKKNTYLEECKAAEEEKRRISKKTWT